MNNIPKAPSHSWSYSQNNTKNFLMKNLFLFSTVDNNKVLTLFLAQIHLRLSDKVLTLKTNKCNCQRITTELICNNLSMTNIHLAPHIFHILIFWILHSSSEITDLSAVRIESTSKSVVPTDCSRTFQLFNRRGLKKVPEAPILGSWEGWAPFSNSMEWCWQEKSLLRTNSPTPSLTPHTWPLQSNTPVDLC